MTTTGGYVPFIWFQVDPAEIAMVLLRALTDIGYSPVYKGPSIETQLLFPIENDVHENLTFFPCDQIKTQRPLGAC